MIGEIRNLCEAQNWVAEQNKKVYQDALWKELLRGFRKSIKRVFDTKIKKRTQLNTAEQLTIIILKIQIRNRTK